MSILSSINMVRRNHAIEHATVAILLERGVSPPMGGYSIPAGFVIWSRASPEEVSDAANHALELLRSGNSELAISPYCGGNLVATALIGGLAAKVFAGGRRGFWPTVRGTVAALVFAGALGRPTGMFLQRRCTTLSEVDAVALGSARRLFGGSRMSVVWVGSEILDP